MNSVVKNVSKNHHNKNYIKKFAILGYWNKNGNNWALTKMISNHKKRIWINIATVQMSVVAVTQSK